MTSWKTGSSLFLRNKIQIHLPISETHTLLYQKFLRRPVDVMAHPAVPAFVPVDMKPVKILFPIPETGAPLGLLRINDICIVAEKTESETLRVCW